MSTTPARTARAHHAVRTDDVLACTFAQLDVRDGLIDGVAAVCKTWSSAWRRRCLGSYRMAAMGIGPFDYAEYVSACPMAGVLVSDYGKARLIEVLLVRGEVQTVLCQNISGPDGLACCADGTAWVIARDSSCIVHVALEPNNTITEWPHSLGEEQGRYFQRIEFDFLPVDIQIAGKCVLVLIDDENELGRVDVFDAQTTAKLYSFGQAQEGGYGEELRAPKCMAVH